MRVACSLMVCCRESVCDASSLLFFFKIKDQKALKEIKKIKCGLFKIMMPMRVIRLN